MDTFLIIGVVAIIWILESIKKVLVSIRTLLELPSSAKKKYDEELSKLSDEIETDRIAVLISPSGEVENGFKKHLEELIEKRKHILEQRKKYFHD